MIESSISSVVIILLGPPGAGKGTHAGPLSQQLSIPHISTGDLFRENIRKATPLGLIAKDYIDQGLFAPDEFVLEMLFERVAKPDCKNGYILDGFPRTINQAEVFEARVGSRHEVIALNFYLSDSLIVERITGRIACKSCGRPYHLRYSPPKKAQVCDSCGETLYKRKDDSEEIIRKRLEVYRAQSESLIAYYGQKKNILWEINSEKSKDEVFADVLDALSALART